MFCLIYTSPPLSQCCGLWWRCHFRFQGWGRHYDVSVGKYTCTTVILSRAAQLCRQRGPGYRILTYPPQNTHHCSTGCPKKRNPNLACISAIVNTSYHSSNIVKPKLDALK